MHMLNKMFRFIDLYPDLSTFFVILLSITQILIGN